MEAYRSIIMEGFRELLSYVEVLFQEATEEWYAQRDPVEVDWVECDCIHQAEQFAHLMEEYRERLFTYVPGSTFRELPLAQTLYITVG